MNENRAAYGPLDQPGRGQVTHKADVARLAYVEGNLVPGGNAMKLPRRHFLHLTAAAAVVAIAPRAASALDFPTRPVHIVVGYTAGSTPDLNARLVGQWLSERLGQSFVISNQPGAGTNIATEAVVRAPPDGYVLLYVVAPNAINATLYEKLNFNFINDIAPVAFILRVPMVMVVTPSLPAQTVPQFIDYAKSNPGKISVGSTGIGTASHLAGELFKFMSGIDTVHVPYRGSGGPLANDLLSGQVQVSFLGLAAIIGHIRSGKLRALAVTSARRLDALPDVPALGEFVPGYEAITWDGLGAPKNTPRGIIDQLNREINAGLADAKLNARFREVGGEPAIMSPAEFGQFIASETEKWGKIIKLAGIKAE